MTSQQEPLEPDLQSILADLGGANGLQLLQNVVNSGGALPLAGGTMTGPITNASFNGTFTFLEGATTASYLQYRTLNGDDNVLLSLGTGQAITDLTNQVYMSTISYPNVNTAGNAEGIALNIGQYQVTATDGASNVTRTGQWANIEMDFIQFNQTGGTATFNDVVNNRFRFSIPKTGVTIANNKGIDFVVPLASDVTGSVTNYTAINIPALTGGGGTNFYGITFNNNPNGGSISSVNNDLSLVARTAGTNITLTTTSTGSIVLTPGSSGTVRLGNPNGVKTQAYDVTTSPYDVYKIQSVGQTGGWQGTIDLKVGFSTGTLYTGLRITQVSNSAGHTAIGFYGVTPVLQQVSSSTLAGVIAGLVALGLFSS